jgi:hypothetical protein
MVSSFENRLELWQKSIYFYLTSSKDKGDPTLATVGAIIGYSLSKYF